MRHNAEIYSSLKFTCFWKAFSTVSLTSMSSMFIYCMQKYFCKANYLRYSSKHNSSWPVNRNSFLQKKFQFIKACRCHGQQRKTVSMTKYSCLCNMTDGRVILSIACSKSVITKHKRAVKGNVNTIWRSSSNSNTDNISCGNHVCTLINLIHCLDRPKAQQFRM
jgi:hypothetical protein